MANLFSKKIKGEENRTQLQPVIFADKNKESIAALKKSQIDTYNELESYKRLRTKRKKKAFIRMIVWLLCLTLIPVFVFLSIVIINPKAGHNFFGYTIYIVSTDSMKPDINPGDCIVVKKIQSREELKIGTDISFIRKSDGQTVTHKIIGTVVNDDGEIEYITKGSHVPTADPVAVAYEEIIGVRIKTIAWFGQTITFFRTPYGIVVFLAIFASILVAIHYAFKFSNDIRAVGLK